MLETSRLASTLKRTMNDVWSNLNPKVAEVEERREVEEEEKTRRKEEAAGNVNELERSMALVGTYDERQAISDEGGLKYGVDTRASREVRENYFSNQSWCIFRCLFLVVAFCISPFADHNILCFFLYCCCCYTHPVCTSGTSQKKNRAPCSNVCNEKIRTTIVTFVSSSTMSRQRDKRSRV